MKNTLRGWGLGFFILLLIIMMINVFFYKDNLNESIDTLEFKRNTEIEKWQNPLHSYNLIDNIEVYKNDTDSHLDNLYVTILPPSGKGTVTFTQLNDNKYNTSSGYVSDVSDPIVEVFFEVEKPGAYKNSQLKPNATMELRGQTARLAEQKSYKIKLFESAGDWNGVRNINLNKHFYATFRIENKLAFDLFEMIPDFVSLRTRFVKLFIKDLSARKSDNKFQYYGLYTFVEQPNKRFLESHQLDKEGYLYKAEFFEFFRYEDSIKQKDDLTYDQNKFESILEVCGNDNHQYLIEMLEAVNNYNLDINKVVENYFNRENLLTWLAVNILLDNPDTNSRNFFLYSPLNSGKWYFLPWDYDDIWYRDVSRKRWQKSIGNYWGMVLFNRFLKDQNNIESLNRKIEEISFIINKDNIQKLLDSYYKVVTDNIFIPPDIHKLIIRSQSEYSKEYYALANFAENSKREYYASLENPMPFFLGEPEIINGVWTFRWDSSYDMQNDELVYNFMLSNDPNFKNLIVSYPDLKKTICSVSDLKPGKYYWKVVVYDSKGNWQEAFDDCKDDHNHTLSGVKVFIIP